MATLHSLMDMVENGFVLVFPTEESARAFSSLFVMERKKGLLASSCIAFDSFAMQFMPEIKGKIAAGDIDRLIFSSYASSCVYSKMRYFVSPSYPELQTRLTSFLRPILPLLDDAMQLEQKNRDATHDLRLLRFEYGVFLDKLNLYEGNFSEIVIPSSLDKTYAVVMPSAFPKERRVMNAISSLQGVEIIGDLKAALPPLQVYANEKNEIRSLFSSIRSLVDDGVTMDEIAISVAPLDRLRPYIEDEAYLFGIPLDFREGVLVASTAPGAFLSGLYEIFSSSYSLDSLKAFMLNPSIPFRDPEMMRRFIASAVRFSITSAPDRKKDRYMKLSKDSGQEYYRILRLTLDRLMTETDPMRCESLLHTLMSSLLVDEEFHGNEEDEAVYSFAMREFSSFLSSCTAAVEEGYLNTPLFPLFMSYFSTLRYVPRTRVEGVSVYPFTQDAAVPFRYRFIIGLNGKEGEEKIRKASFLSDYELAVERGEEDITEDLLSLYAAMTEHLVLSASYETYAGFALPLTFMLRSAESAHLDIIDPLRAEEKGLQCHILPVQKRSFERASVSALRKREKKDDMTYMKAGKNRALPVTLSYSSYNAYARCPYLYALQYVFSLKDLPSYEPVDMDHLEIGSRLHSILERYYREGCTCPDSDIPRLFNEEMMLWTEGKSFSHDGSALEMPSSASRPTPFLISYLKARYLHRIEDVVRKMDEVSKALEGGRGLEEPLSAEFKEEGFILDGRVDRIAETKDGSAYIIYDYKKGRSFKSELKAEKSFQFHLYRLLLGRNESFPLPVTASFFVSLLDGKISESSPSPSPDDLIDALRKMADGVAAGDWHAISSDTNCKGCVYKGICRRRFGVR